MVNGNYNTDSIVSQGGNKLYIYLYPSQIEILKKDKLIKKGKVKTYMGWVKYIEIKSFTYQKSVIKNYSKS